MQPIRLLLIHGAWCNAWHLNALAIILEKAGFLVTLLMLPGHGYGEDPSGYSISDYVKAVEDDLAQNGPAVLIGHSMGGFVAQIVAAKNPKVLGSVLAAPAGKPSGGFIFGKDLLKRLIHPHYWWGMLIRRGVRCADQDLRDLLLNKVPKSMQAREVRTFGLESGRALLQLALAQFRFWEKCKKLFGPVLVLVGDSDKTMPPSLERDIAQAYGRHLFVVRDAGHMLFSEPCAERVAAHIARWIKRAVRQPVGVPAE